MIPVSYRIRSCFDYAVLLIMSVTSAVRIASRIRTSAIKALLPNPKDECLQVVSIVN